MSVRPNIKCQELTPRTSVQPSDKPIAYWLMTGCALICIMVALGGITRITQSGLSMTTWNITGSLPPMEETEWTKEFSRYQEFPEYKLINRNFTLEEFKNIYWWEYFHRMIGRLTGIVFLIPLAWFVIKRKLPSDFIPKALLLLLMGASQGALGWLMVRSGLNRVPHVSHYLLAAHFALALFTLAITFWFAQQILSPQKEKSCISKLKKWSATLLTLISLQMIYGALLAGLKAGHLYPTFPLMGENWIAPEILSRTPVWLNFFQDGAGVQFIHRILGTSILLMGILFTLRTKKFPLSPVLRRAVRLIAYTVTVQFTLGLLTLLCNVPPALAFAHQLCALALFLNVVFITYRTFHHNPLAIT